MKFNFKDYMKIYKKAYWINHKNEIIAIFIMFVIFLFPFIGSIYDKNKNQSLSMGLFLLLLLISIITIFISYPIKKKKVEKYFFENSVDGFFEIEFVKINEVNIKVIIDSGSYSFLITEDNCRSVVVTNELVVIKTITGITLPFPKNDNTIEIFDYYISKTDKKNKKTIKKSK